MCHCVAVPHFVYALIDIWVLSTFLAVEKNAAMNIFVHIFCEYIL